MSDFFLDFRPTTQRDPDRAASFLKFFPDFQVFRIDEPGFSLVLTRCDDEAIWSPYRSADGRVLIAIAGRIAPENSEWEQAKHVPGSGGLACKVIYQKYCENGLRALERFNGSYVIILYDAQSGRVCLVGDRCGMFPLFKRAASDLPPVFSSHPDLLALSAADASDYDTTSLAEFLVRGQVSYPFSYYRGVVGAEYASIHRIALDGGAARALKPERYFELTYSSDLSDDAPAMAERLAAALRKAVARRTHRNFGTIALGLSGGLDSRLILCACPDLSVVTAFCFHDEENVEFSTAKAIAAAKGVKLLPFKRDFDHYGQSAEDGVRFSGAMSSVLTNHLLGFRQHFK
jgi:asparagine synthetase B (glutamine-hydrolysing)